MLQNAELERIARLHVEKHGTGFVARSLATFDDPNGVFYNFARADGNDLTGTYSPFFVSRTDGRITVVDPRVVIMKLADKLFGPNALQKNRDLQRAMVADKLNDPKLLDIWSKIIREVIRLEGKQ